MNKYALMPLLCLLLTALSACHRPSQPVEARPIPSPHFFSDSLRTLGRGIAHLRQRTLTGALPLLDSVFLLPVPSDAPTAGSTPDTLSTLTPEELRLLCSQSIQWTLTYFNLLMDFDAGYRYLDSLEHARHPIVSRHCRRELWVVKAQMLMALDRHAEAIDYLNRAMSLQGENDDPLSEIFCTATAGITYMGVDTISTPAEAAFLRTCRAAERSGNTDFWLYPQAVGRLADIYLQQGKYEQSISLCRDAIRLCDDAGSYHGKLVAAEILTEAYRRLELYDEAFRYCSVGTAEPARSEIDNNLIGRFFRAKARIYNSRQQPDSALHALAQADSCFDRTRSDYYHLIIRIDRMYYLSSLPDSLPAALQGFAALDGNVPRHSLPYYEYYYGVAHTRAGNWSAAIPRLRTAIPQLKAISELHPASEAAALLMEAYRRASRPAEMLTFYPHYRLLRDSLTRSDKIRQLASANIRFETQKKEQENRALTAEVRLQHTRLQTYSAAGAAALLLILSVAAWLVMRHRNLRLRFLLEAQQRERADERVRQQEVRLRQLITARQDLYKRNRTLLRQLSDIQARHNNTCDLDPVMQALQTQFLTRKEEDSFRAAFAATHPSALMHLRQACPGVSRSEELFCMLVHFVPKNEELARTLGISPASVSKTRYRLRLKLGLPEGSDVDAEIRRIMGI